MELNDRVIICEQQLKNLKDCYDNVCKQINSLGEKIDNLEIKLLGRPSWIICIIIAALCTLCSSLIVAIVLLK